MEVEKIVEVLGKSCETHYVLRRTVKQPSTVTNQYMTYVMELWQLGGVNPNMIFQTEGTGLYIGDNKKQLINNVEEKFLMQLFLYIKRLDKPEKRL